MAIRSKRSDNYDEYYEDMDYTGLTPDDLAGLLGGGRGSYEEGMEDEENPSYYPLDPDYTLEDEEEAEEI